MLTNKCSMSTDIGHKAINKYCMLTDIGCKAVDKRKRNRLRPNTPNSK